MKTLCLFLLLIPCYCLGQPHIKPIDQKSIPAIIHYKGVVDTAVSWVDSLGKHFIILSKGTAIDKEDTSNYDYNLFACHYIQRKDSLRLIWKLHDYVNDCMVDVFLYFMHDAFTITDLNHDGIPETWVMYKNSCQGDISAVGMKLIMYEGNKKYAARGTSKTVDDPTSGTFTLDDAFRSGPGIFREYAKQLWGKHKKEDWKQWHDFWPSKK